jgi:hypothetical protein
MKPKLTPVYQMLNVLLSLALIATVDYQAFQSGLEWGLIAILGTGPLFVISLGLLNSQFDTTSQEKADSRGRYSQSEDDACTTKTKENDKDI